MPCVKLSEVYWIPGKGLEVLSTPKPWLTQAWDFAETTDPAGTPKYDFSPPNEYGPDEFEAFFAEFSADPEFQLANTSWPLQVFHIDPEEPGLHVEKTVFYVKPAAYDRAGRSLFPLAADLTTDELNYTVRLTDANTGPQAGVVLYKNGADDMLYVYAFLWHNGWYLLEISHLTANGGF